MTSIVEPSHHSEATFANTCHEGNTDFQVEISEFNYKIASIMTRRVNLGLGLSQEDPIWEAHVFLSFGLRRRLNGDGPEHFLTAHSPRSCFEDIAPQSFEDLRSRSLLYLKDQ
jgi:hypothetical protein